MGPDSFVLGLLGQVFTVLIIVNPGTLDDATTMATVGRFAATFDFQFGLSLAADFLGPFKLTGLKVVGRVAARFVKNVGQHIGAVGRQAFTRDRVLADPFDKGAVGNLESFSVLWWAVFTSGII